MNNCLISTLATLGFGLLPTLAAATPPPGVFRDFNGNVYLHGSAASLIGAGARLATSEDLVRNVRAGYCGELRLSASNSLPVLGDRWQVGNGTTISRSSLVTITSSDLLPRCRGNSFSPAPTAAMTTAGGFIDNTGSGPKVYLLGRSPGTNYAVTFLDVPDSISVRLNDCGFARLSNSASNPLPTAFSLGGTNYTVASLPVAAPPLCQRQGGNYIRYTPSTW